MSSATYRFGGSYRWTISPTATLEDDARLTGTFDKADDWRFLNLVSLTAQLTQLLSLKVSNTVRYLHLPAYRDSQGTDTTTSDRARCEVHSAVTVSDALRSSGRQPSPGAYHHGCSPAPASRPPRASRRSVDAGGLWKTFRPETLATPSAFARDPRLVWEWYDWRRQRIKDAKPNAAHDVLAAWTRERPGFTLITQNVDGLHERAGARRPHQAPRIDLGAEVLDAMPRWRHAVADETRPFADLPPRCPHCNAIARPAVVWFGEGLDPHITQQPSARRAATSF